MPKPLAREALTFLTASGSIPHARRTLATLTPTLRDIVRQDNPWSLITRTSSRRNTALGRPISLPLLVPFCLARANPAYPFRDANAFLLRNSP